MDQHPWRHPSQADRGWDQPLPAIVELKPDYGAELPLWGDGLGNISWQFTKFSPQLLDRLAAWQQDFDTGFDRGTGWRSAELRDRWASQAENLAADVQAELGTRARLIADLWPLSG
jgi:hypothetical protein